MHLKSSIDEHHQQLCASCLRGRQLAPCEEGSLSTWLHVRGLPAIVCSYKCLVVWLEVRVWVKKISK